MSLIALCGRVTLRVEHGTADGKDGRLRSYLEARQGKNQECYVLKFRATGVLAFAPGNCHTCGSVLLDLFSAMFMRVFLRLFNRLGWDGHDQAAVLHAFEAYEPACELGNGG